jgi:alkanesulfonate monooxygenase SsuD/methylene tetrahydromethanopterin reductase-like flavin-dependent oxidoreductase (luciferase family)
VTPTGARGGARRGFALFAGAPAEVLRASAVEAEAAGYGSFWVNYPGSIDGIAALAAATGETRRLELGIGVIPLSTRGPASIVEGVRHHGLPLARLLLGVGSPNPRALARVDDGVRALRAQLPARLVVAALGPRMCRLAGEVADGVLLNWLTPEHARRSAEWVRAGALAAGRGAPQLYAYVRVALGPAGRARLGEEGARYAAIPAYAAHFARMGVDPVETAIAARSPTDLAGALASWDGAVDEVVIRAITAEDTVEANLAVLQAAKPA